MIAIRHLSRFVHDAIRLSGASASGAPPGPIHRGGTYESGHLAGPLDVIAAGTMRSIGPNAGFYSAL